MVEEAGMNNKKLTRVAFADFWQGFNPHDFILSAVLKERLNMVIVRKCRKQGL